MSLHASLKASGQGKRHRNVLKKYERVEMLQDQKKWSEGESVLGIPKVRSIKLRKKKAAKTPEEAAASAAGAEGAPDAAAPAKDQAKKPAGK